MLARQLNAAYGFAETATGLYLLVPAFGNIAGAVGGGFVADKILNRNGDKGKIPEFRLYIVYLAVALSFVGLTGFGLVLYYKVHCGYRRRLFYTTTVLTIVRSVL
jgi:hypothetical protein